MNEFNQYKSIVNISEIGIDGMKKIQATKILVVGMGGLGCPVALYLASSGVGQLGIMDDDTVEISNISRQPLYGVHDGGKRKVDVAYVQLLRINPRIKIVPIKEKFSLATGEKLVREYHYIIDCSDNFQTKLLINDLCRICKKNFVYGSI